MCPVFLICSFSIILLSSQATFAAPEDAVPKKEEGISDKSSLLTLDEEHDLLKAESQDVPSEVKPLYQVSVKPNSVLFFHLAFYPPLLYRIFILLASSLSLFFLFLSLPSSRAAHLRLLTLHLFSSLLCSRFTFNDALVKC